MYWLYRRRDFLEHHRVYKKKVENLEVETKVVTPTTQLGAGQPITQELTWMFQATQYIGCGDEGQCRINNTPTPTSTIDELTNASVAAHARFDDYGGKLDSGVYTASADGYCYDATAIDEKGKSAAYHYSLENPCWATIAPPPSIVHTSVMLASHVFKCNVPGTAENDKYAFFWYGSNSAFNTTTSFSVSIWFYPTDISPLGAETLRLLIFRQIDASNSLYVCINTTDQKLYIWVKDAGVTSKLVSNATLTINQWHNLCFTYNASTDALVMYLDNSSASSVPAAGIPNVGDATLYIGGQYNTPDRRFTGYIDNFVWWTNKVLTSGEVGNMWNHGTIV